MLKTVKDYDEAEDSFRNANAIQRHSATFLELADIYVAQKSYDEAIDVFTEALEFTPDNPELLFRVGITHLAAGNSFKAFECLGNALTHNPKLSEAILAAGSMLQEKDDVDVALIKYRVAAIQRPNSPELWSNIGMAFFFEEEVCGGNCLSEARTIFWPMSGAYLSISESCIFIPGNTHLLFTTFRLPSI